jgi:hypothetical protein
VVPADHGDRATTRLPVRRVASATQEATVNCPHGASSTPSSCSQCLGVPAKRVSQIDNLITVDGEVVRPIELAPWHPGIRRDLQFRGGKNRP